MYNVQYTPFVICYYYYYYYYSVHTHILVHPFQTQDRSHSRPGEVTGQMVKYGWLRRRCRWTRMRFLLLHFSTYTVRWQLLCMRLPFLSIDAFARENSRHPLYLTMYDARLQMVSVGQMPVIGGSVIRRDLDRSWLQFLFVICVDDGVQLLLITL